MRTLIRKIYLVGGMCGLVFTASAANGSPVAIDSTMNALDYVLQRPAPAERFASKRFGDRLFISLELGPDWMRTNTNLLNRPDKTGYKAGLTVGDWITPVHGWRLGVNAGRHFGVNGMKPFFVGISLDYLMNLSSLLRKDNPSRRFELIGVMGLEGQALHRRGHKLWGAAGARIALQPRVYVTSSTYLYAEPRIGIYTDALDDVSTWHKYDWNASVMLGLGYRMTGGRGITVDNSLFSNDYFRDNLFIGFSGGMSSAGNSVNDLRDRLIPTGLVSLGKWFSATAGLRISGGGIRLRHPDNPSRTGAIADLDFMWNLNSAFVGYDPDARIETNVILGASALYLSGTTRNFHPGLHAGLQGIWKVSPSVGFYLEPNLRIFNRHLTTINTGRATLMPGLNVGMTYRFNNSQRYNEYRTTFDYSEFFSSRRYFFDLLGGVFMRSRTWNPNYAVTLGFGKWFTPESGWRVNGEFESLQEKPDYRSLSLSADYLLSLSALANGYDGHRIFDLDAFIGMTAGAANRCHGNNSIIWGPRAGLRGRIGVSDALDIIIEPQLQVLSIPDYTHRYNPELRLMAGVSYKLGRTDRSGAIQSNNLDYPAWGLRPFVNVSGAPVLYSESIFNYGLRTVSWGMTASLGAWLSDASGLQLGFAYDCVPYSSRSNQEIKSFSLDYMLNLTNIFTGETGRKFEVVPFAGIGLGWGSCKDSKAALSLEGGIRASYRLNDRLDLTLTPTVTIWDTRLNGKMRNMHHFIGVGRLPLGVSYRF